ncbi:hypothetical protein [Mycobacteroides abscessus]|uniref:hypothetical protein n=1 Tax=Mycobacteroides abscessus TaxID=36809 RepID=UPI000E688FE9|nr:hypothetical protein [Mycobacteroides abscessus]RIS81342.1 hypothetical protein D2E44_14920 [Mycobacteroides abscessus]
MEHLAETTGYIDVRVTAVALITLIILVIITSDMISGSLTYMRLYALFGAIVGVVAFMIATAVCSEVLLPFVAENNAAWVVYLILLIELLILRFLVSTRRFKARVENADS